MCTVSFLPIDNENFILTSNRDEAVARAAMPPQEFEQENGQVFLYPVDEQSGGSWIGTTNDGRMACLLNGATENHERKLPYDKSRGTLVLSFLRGNEESLLGSEPLGNMEPFTLIMHKDGKLWELRWNGKRKFLKQLDMSKPYIWSSATLYPKPIRRKREKLFRIWQEENTFSQRSILHFHHFEGMDDPENDLVMSRDDGNLRTLSITSIWHDSKRLRMTYLDLMENKSYMESLVLKKENAPLESN